MTRALRTRPGRTGALPILSMPYAGAGEGCFANLASKLAPAAELVTVRLPGRGARWGETPATDVRSLAADLVADIGDWFDEPYALFGCSMGALLAFEFAHTIRACRGVEPAYLIVAGLQSPDRLETVPRLAHLPDDELRAAVGGIGRTDAAILDDPELWSIVSGPLRHDFALVDDYEFVERPPLSSPIAAYASASDAEGPVAGLDAWRQHTRGPFHMRTFPGGHFFFEDRGDESAGELARCLDRIPRPARPTESSTWQTIT